jgi:hypothetical protein
MVQNILWKSDCHSAYQKKNPFSMKLEGSSPCSQKPTTGPYLSQLNPVRPIDPYVPEA